MISSSLCFYNHWITVSASKQTPLSGKLIKPSVKSNDCPLFQHLCWRALCKYIIQTHSNSTQLDVCLSADYCIASLCSVRCSKLVPAVMVHMWDKIESAVAWLPIPHYAPWGWVMETRRSWIEMFLLHPLMRERNALKGDKGSVCLCFCLGAESKKAVLPDLLQPAASLANPHFGLFGT